MQEMKWISVKDKVAPLAGSVDRNHGGAGAPVTEARSLPSRGAWIEMELTVQNTIMAPVAPLAGSVDRNAGVGVCRPGVHCRSPRGERG